MNSNKGGIARSSFGPVLKWINAFGIDPLRFRSALRNLPLTVRDFRALSAQNERSDDKWHIDFRSPCFHDRADAGGTASGHYFHQDLLVARRIFERNPQRHIDVGSRVDGLVAHVAVFREIEVFDIRPVATIIKNIKFVQRDITLPAADIRECCDSLSSLHAIEHFGLGRYGDTVDLDGYKKGFDVLTSMLKPGGVLYLSVPVGRERIEFNGHRVFAVERVLELANEQYELIAFSYVDDRGDFHEAGKVPANVPQVDHHLEYGCGIFEFRKNSDS
jgi:hypothetical protein